MPLKLTRKTGETIVLDGPAVVEVVAIHKSWVTLSVDAPDSTVIRRGEVKPFPVIDRDNDPNREQGEAGA
jgi:carbon storage regulator CsrA